MKKKGFQFFKSKNFEEKSNSIIDFLPETFRLMLEHFEFGRNGLLIDKIDDKDEGRVTELEMILHLPFNTIVFLNKYRLFLFLNSEISNL